MKRAVSNCPICDVVMVDEPHRRESKELDHVIPISLGGAHAEENLRVICKRCNSARGNRTADLAGIRLTLGMVSG